MAESAAEELRLRGNDALRRGDAAEAVRSYSAALDALRPALGAVACEAAGVLHSNRAAARLKLGGTEQLRAALRDTADALRQGGARQKALFRKAQALTALAAERAAELRSGGAPEWALTPADEEAAAELGGGSPPLGLAARSEWGLLLSAQEALGALVAAGARQADVRSALTAARGAALEAAVRGPVELRRAGAHAGGVGLFACRGADPGEVLLEDDAVAFVREKGDWRERGRMVVAQLEKLAASDPRKLEWVQDLHRSAADCQDRTERLYCIWDCNGHSVGDIDFRVAETTSVGVALYVAASRVNHSCAPNAVQCFCPNTGRIRLLALDALREGDEIFISYCPPYGSAATRREKLKFDCGCLRCKDSADPLGGGDPEVVAAVQRRVDEVQRMAQAAQDAGAARAADRAALLQEAQRAALALSAEADAQLGEEHEIAFGATLLCVKICAGAPDGLALPHARRLQRLCAKHLHPRWPLQASAKVYTAVQEGLASPDNEAELLPFLFDAFEAHRVSVGCPFPEDSSRRPGESALERDDAIGLFWRRYRAELTALDIDTAERARMLFASRAP